MPIRKKSEFGEWFRQQAGPRSIQFQGHPASDPDLQEMITVGELALRELRARMVWDEQHKFALYGWNTRNSTKKEP